MAGLLQSQSKVEPQCGFAAAHRGKPSAYRNLPLTFFEAAPQFTEAQPRPRPVKRLRKGKPFRYVLRHSRFFRSFRATFKAKVPRGDLQIWSALAIPIYRERHRSGSANHPLQNISVACSAF